MDENTNPQAIDYDALEAQKQPEATKIPEPTQAPDQINVLNPEGSLVSIPSGYLQEALGSGYSEAPKEMVDKYLKDEKYGSTSQQVITGLEGAAQGVVGPLAPLVETEAFGVKPEDILGRKETNPGTALASEVAGLGGSMVLGTGLGSIAAKAGGLGAAGVLGAETLAQSPKIAKLGSAAVRGFIENSIIAGSDEAAKLILKDPNTSVQTAITDVGLSGLLGGAIGGAGAGAHTLWKNTFGKETAQVLDAIANKAGGIEGVVESPIEQAIKDSGLDIAPEIKAAVVNDPAIQQMFSTLQESATKSGLKTQVALKEFRQKAAEGITSALGKTPEQIANLEHLSTFEAGENVKKSLIDTLKEKLAPISERFEGIKQKYSKEAVGEEFKAKISSDIGDLMASEGYGLSPSSSQFKVIQSTLQELPNIKSLEDLRKYTSIISDKTSSNPELYRLGKQLKGILRGAEEDVVTRTAGRIAPEAVGEHELARDSYREAMGIIDNLNDRLHVGRYAGPDSFINALKEMSPEDVIRRLSPKNDAGLITELTSQFPKVAEGVKDYYLSQSLKGAASRALPGEVINSKAFLKAIDGLSPEMRDFLVPPEANLRIRAIQSVSDAIPSKMNPSGTAKAIDALTQHFPASGAGIAALIMGHGLPGAVAGAAIGQLGKLLARDVPDAIKLATLKFLGSDKPVSPGAFKAMVEFMHSTIRGENLLSRGTKSVFSSGKEVLPNSMVPTEGDRTKLKKLLVSYEENPQKAFDMAGDTGHYLPDQAAAIAGLSVGAVEYLNSLKPDTKGKAPLDGKMVANPVQESVFNNALNIAQQPLLALKKIQQGTLVPTDVITLQKLYPDLYGRMVDKLNNEIVDITSKGDSVPYKTRIGLSMFMGQPLDSTMTPNAIRNAQPVDEQQMDSGPAKAKPGTKAFQDASQSYMTGSQARIAHRQN